MMRAQEFRPASASAGTSRVYSSFGLTLEATYLARMVVAVVEDDADGAVALDDHLAHAGVGFDLGAVRARPRAPSPA